MDALAPQSALNALVVLVLQPTWIAGIVPWVRVSGHASIPYHSLSTLWFINRFNQLFQLAAGLYLFFGGRWIANLAIPGNRPYCPECAYDLTGVPGTICPECGTLFRSATPTVVR